MNNFDIYDKYLKTQISIQEFDKLFTEHQKLAHQIDKLALFIIENIDGEPSKSEGVIDTAIRLLKKYAPIY